ncbi:MAG: rod shape-determining protein MreC [Treponema sp.]|nr:MAG: rod shape-determining protein MreC [Treponema sp.]
MKKPSLKFKLDVFLLIIFLLISSGLMFFSGGGFFLNFKRVGFSFISETESAVYSASSFIGETIASVRELAEIKQKYKEAVQKLADYELIQRNNANMLKENKQLKSLLGFSKQISIKNIPAEIIGFDPNHLYSGILVNRGIKQGVRKNMPVVAFQNSDMGLVGKVVEVSRNTSLIIPIYDYQCSVAGKIELSRHKGIVTGAGRDDKPLTMKYIKKRAQSEIKIGDKIVTSGFDDSSIFPKNISIGTIAKIIIRNYETSLELKVDPVIDFSKLEYVFILDTTNTGQTE